MLPSVDSSNVPGATNPDEDAYALWIAAHAPPFPPVDMKSGWEPQARRTGKYLKIVGCTLQTESSDPLKAAKRWSELYRVPLVENHEDGGVPAIVFSNAVIRFVKARDGRGDGIQRLDVVLGLCHFASHRAPPFSHSIDLLHPDPASARARASAYPGAVSGPDGEVFLVGVWWRFKSADEVDKRISKTATGWIEGAARPKI